MKQNLPVLSNKGSFSAVRGGDSRIRTGDLLNAIQTLYQLSYIPKDWVQNNCNIGGKKYQRLLLVVDHDT